MTSDKTSRFGRGRLVLRYEGTGLLLVGAGLLTIAALGHWTGLGDYVSRPARSWELFDRTLVERTPTIEALYQAAEQKNGGNLGDLPPQEALQVLFETASARFPMVRPSIRRSAIGFSGYWGEHIWPWAQSETPMSC